jgi:hypothetical protein
MKQSGYRSNRQGYAMLLVLAFAMLFFSLLAMACSQLSSSILAETARIQQTQRDEGSVRAVGRALALLETGYPPTNPYSCGVSIDTSTGTRPFTVTFVLNEPQNWSVTAAPAESDENPPAMPLMFTEQSPP